MYSCEECRKVFRTRYRLKKHSQRKNPCRKPTHFCSMCYKGTSSRRSLYQHKKRCEKKIGDSTNEERLQSLKKIVCHFFEHLSEDFKAKLQDLESVFEEELKDNEHMCCEHIVNSD